MRVKGTAVKSIPEFIKAEHGSKYTEWLDSLPMESKKLFINGIKTSDWYSVEHAIIIPTVTMSELLYQSETKGAWECGRYSAKAALTGIYSLYVKMSSPGHIIDRAGRVLQAYYEPSELNIVSKGKNNVTLHITKFPKPHKVIDARLAGWMERALELSGCKNIKINITKSLLKGDAYTEFAINWE